MVVLRMLWACGGCAALSGCVSLVRSQLELVTVLSPVGDGAGLTAVPFPGCCAQACVLLGTVDIVGR